MFEESWLGYIFVDLDDEFDGKEIVLYEGIVLRKARLSELTRHFDWHLDNWWKLRGGNAKYYAHARTVVEGITTKATEDKTLWKHFVIDCTNTQINPVILNLIFAISKADMRMGFVQFDRKPSFMSPWSSWPQLGRWYDSGNLSYTGKIKINQIEELKQNINDFVINEREQKHLRLLYMFESLDTMVDSNPFKFLGYFSIIEGLLTYKPNNTDNLDSIQKQLIRNINLINNRVESSGRIGIDYQFFNNSGLKKIFSKLYSLRSDIAHGSEFNSAFQDVLKLTGKKHCDEYLARHLVYSWLRDLTKMVLMHAFVEPLLYLDLTNDGKK